MICSILPYSNFFFLNFFFSISSKRKWDLKKQTETLFPLNDIHEYVFQSSNTDTEY